MNASSLTRRRRPSFADRLFLRGGPRTGANGGGTSAIVLPRNNGPEAAMFAALNDPSKRAVSFIPRNASVKVFETLVGTVYAPADEARCRRVSLATGMGMGTEATRLLFGPGISCTGDKRFITRPFRRAVYRATDGTDHTGWILEHDIAVTTPPATAQPAPSGPVRPAKPKRLGKTIGPKPPAAASPPAATPPAPVAPPAPAAGPAVRTCAANPCRFYQPDNIAMSWPLARGTRAVVQPLDPQGRWPTPPGMVFATLDNGDIGFMRDADLMGAGTGAEVTSAAPESSAPVIASPALRALVNVGTIAAAWTNPDALLRVVDALIQLDATLERLVNTNQIRTELRDVLRSVVARIGELRSGTAPGQPSSPDGAGTEEPMSPSDTNTGLIVASTVAEDAAWSAYQAARGRFRPAVQQALYANYAAIVRAAGKTPRAPDAVVTPASKVDVRLAGTGREGRVVSRWAAVLPEYAFSGQARSWAQIEDGSRILPQHARLVVYETLDLPKSPANRVPFLPSSMTADGAKTIRVYRVRYTGASVDPSFRRQFNDPVNGWIDASHVLLM